MLIFGIYGIVIGALLLSYCPIIFKFIKKYWYYNEFYSQSSILVIFICILVGLYFIITTLPIFFHFLNVIFGDRLIFNKITFPINIALDFVIFNSSIIIFLFNIFYFFKYKRKKYLKVTDLKKIKIFLWDIKLSDIIFQICIIGVIVCYLDVGYLFNLVYKIPYWLIIWSSGAGLILGKAVCMFVFIIIGNLLLVKDFIRIYNYELYPIKEISFDSHVNRSAVLGSKTLLVFGMLFSTFLFSGPIAMSTIAMSGFGDACATIFGVIMGKHHIRGGKSPKTWEGCIAGFFSSLSLGLVSYILVGLVWYGKNLHFITILLIGVIINAIGATVFLLMDYYTPSLPLMDFYKPPIEISRKILNPIVLPIVMSLSSLLIFGLW